MFNSINYNQGALLAGSPLLTGGAPPWFYIRFQDERRIPETNFKEERRMNGLRWFVIIVLAVLIVAGLANAWHKAENYKSASAATAKP